jgi:signal transduction histidine kinase
MKELVVAVREDNDIVHIRALVDQLDKLIDGIGDLFRRSGTSAEKASDLIRQTLFNCQFRFKKHKVEVVNGIDSGSKDFRVDCSRRLVVASLMNFIDNSIYWIQASGRSERRIFIGTSDEIEGGPSIIVADNGPGFQDDPESLVQPFFTRRDDGMGLGLYLAAQAAQRHVADGRKGGLVFPQRGDVTLPKGFSGAVIAFQFANAL